METLSKKDKAILELKGQIETKENQLEASIKFKPKTNLILKMGLGTKNLNVLSSNELLETLAAIGHIPMVLKSLGIDELPVIGNGKFTIEEWIHDIKGKYHLSRVRQEKEKLSVMKQKLEQALSSDYKEEKAFSDLLSDIKDAL